MDRRSFLARLGLTAALAHAPAAAFAATDAGDDLSARVGAMLDRYLALIEEEKKADTAYGAAYDALPEWARSGQSSIRHDGSRSGRHVEWPEIASYKLPEDPLVVHLIRPSLKDVRDRFYLLMPAQDGPARRTQRRQMAEATRRWIARRREQLAAHEAAGIPILEAHAVAIGDQVEDLRIELLDIVDDTGNPDLIACSMFLSLGAGSPRHQEVQGWHVSDRRSLQVLQSVFPRTTGPVRRHVEMYLAKLVMPT